MRKRRQRQCGGFLAGAVLALAEMLGAGCTIGLEPDQDGDGYSARWDCNDLDPAIHPAASEICDARDNDCDSLTDDTDSDEPLANALPWYADADGDSYGSAASPVFACAQPPACVADGSDCDDLDASIHPGAQERCDGRDNDCDGHLDDADPDGTPSGASPWYADEDEDGYGDPTRVVLACLCPEGSVAAPAAAMMDCNDRDTAIHPGAFEICDALDNDCNGQIDDGTAQAALWYADVDQDGHGDPDAYTTGCPGPSGWISLGGDCNDRNAAVFGGAAELCDGLDNDCDLEIDEGVTLTFYPDQDGDGYGTWAGAQESCTPPEGYAAAAGDCDDGASSTYPGAPVLCDGRDNDCDGELDSATVAYYQDSDGDGFGTTAVTVCSPASGYVRARGDCDDLLPQIHPGAEDPPEDGIDQDCGGTGDAEPHVGLSATSLTSLQAALDAAVSGTTIWVGPGRYLERDVSFRGRAVTLASTHFAEETVLDVQRSSGHGFIFTTDEDPDSVLDGFGVTGVGGSSTRSALYVVASSPTIVNAHIFGNYLLVSGNGVGLYLKWSNAVVRNTIFENNNGLYAGGAAYVDASSPTFERCTFTQNAAQWGGAFYSVYSSPTVIGSIFNGNKATSAGGGLYLFRSTASISRTSITDNSGGGLYAYDDDSILSHSIFRGNLNWGALSIESSYTRYEHTRFEDNDGTGLVLIEYSGKINHCWFSGNTSSGRGAAIYLDEGSPALSNSILLDNFSEGGGAVFIDDGNLTLSHVVISGNPSASLCGGIEADDDSSIRLTLSYSITAYNTRYNVCLGNETTFVSTSSAYYSPTGQNFHQLSGELDSTNLITEPGFLTYNSTGEPTEFHLAPDSPLIDVGSNDPGDGDGSNRDPGAFGGPSGDEWDLDGDGYPAYFWPGFFHQVPEGVSLSGYDCDDTDPRTPSTQSACL